MTTAANILRIATMFMLLGAAVAPVPASAAGSSYNGYSVCNKTNETISLAIAYFKNTGGVFSEGWWQIQPGGCVRPFPAVAWDDRMYYAETKNAVWSSEGKPTGFRWCVDYRAAFTINNSYPCSDPYVLRDFLPFPDTDLNLTLPEGPARTVVTPSPPPAGMKTALDPVGRFSMSVPIDWSVQTSASGTLPWNQTLTASASNGANVGVLVTPLSGPILPQAWAQTSIPVLQRFKDFKIIKEGPIQVGGRPAYSRLQTLRTDQGVAVYQVQVYVVSGQTGFLITGSTVNEQTRIREDMPRILAVIDTFRSQPGFPM